MSFLNDTTWPNHMAHILAFCHSYGNYNGIYNSLLFHCFDAYKASIFVGPQKHKADSLYLMIQDYQWNPLMITHVGSDVSPRGRVNADKQMRSKYEDYLGECTLPRLWGLSFVGSSLRVYCADVATGTIVPSAEDRLEGAWNIETFSPVGFAVIKEIVKDVVECGGLYEDRLHDVNGEVQVG